jgi:hypothetical protein
MKCTDLYSELSEIDKQQLQWILMKYAFVKVMEVKANLFGKNNLFEEDKQLWEKYILSPQYYAKT